MFDFHTLVLIILIRVIRRRIYRHFMATLHQPHGDILRKLLKASVIIRNTTDANKCYLHNYVS